jgi:hypothetical protein
LVAVRDLYRRLPETYHLQAWELQGTLFMMGYTQELQDEDEIAAAIEESRRGGPQWWRLAEAPPAEENPAA